MDAGAIGVRSSDFDIDEFDQPVPSRFAGKEEMIALAQAMARAGRKKAANRGVWQIVPELQKGEQGQRDSVRKIGELSVAAGGVACTFQPLSPGVKDRLRTGITSIMDEWKQKGARLFGQMSVRPFEF